MRLSELEPKLVKNVLTFWCPKCQGDSAHKIRVVLAPGTDAHGRSWQRGGDFPDSLSGSV